MRLASLFAIPVIIAAFLAALGCGSRGEDSSQVSTRSIPVLPVMRGYTPTKTITPRELRTIIKAAKPYHVALILNSDSFYQATANTFREAATGAGMDVEIQRPSAAGSAAQVALLRSDIGKSYDAVCLIPEGEEAILSMLKKTDLKGLAIVEIGGRAFADAAHKQGVSLNGDIHVDDPQAGILAGTALLVAVGRRNAKIAIIRSNRKDDREADRIEGFLNSIGKKLDIVATETASLESAAAVVKRLVTSQPQLAGIFCSDEALVPAVARGTAASSISARIAVVGFGDSPPIRLLLQSGGLDATVTLNPDAIGTMSAHFVAGLLDGKFEKGTELNMPVNTISGKLKR